MANVEEGNRKFVKLLILLCFLLTTHQSRAIIAHQNSER